MLKIAQLLLLSFIGCDSTNVAPAVEQEPELLEIPCLWFKGYPDKIQVLQSQAEMEKLFKEGLSSFSECSISDLPKIDFSEQSLLGYVVNTEGCESPVIEVSFFRTEKGLILKSEINQIGICRVIQSQKLWWIIDKIDPRNIFLEENHHIE